jgi:hypothetical protein
MSITILKLAKDDDKKADTCSMPLLQTKLDEINNLFKEKKYYEVFSNIEALNNEYGNDENIVRLVAITIFKLLTKNEKYRYNDLLQHVLNKAQDNFFDYILCPYVVGLLLLLETDTKDEVILKIAQRMIKMNPKLLTNVLNELPNDIYRKDLKEVIKRLF